MMTYTRRTTRQATRFHRATGKASLLAACGGLIFWSAVAAHASVTQSRYPRADARGTLKEVIRFAQFLAVCSTVNAQS